MAAMPGADLPSGQGVEWPPVRPFLLAAVGICAFTGLETSAERRGTLSRY
ncbi:hypothetical protein Acsp03_65590 [Actinomadura sp. NBRC 104412]|nr:hypothetical protein [Actinomadura sp. NBRC 104412]GLZ09093.1 hypothetical protein Acsp03_65590 [Actinomadura sp. NBRC 104412]